MVAALLMNGAGDWNRTRNLLITNQLLCQLSYTGVSPKGIYGLPEKIAKQDFGGKGGAGVVSEAGAVGNRPQEALCSDVVPWGGIEPPTYGFSVHRSTD